MIHLETPEAKKVPQAPEDCTFQAVVYIGIGSLGLQLSTKFHDRKES